MPYSAAALTSAETTGFTNDKPMMIVQQAIDAGDAHWTFDGGVADTDKTDSSFPSVRAYDDIGALVTKPVAAISGTISNATQADPCVITATAHGLSNGMIVYIQDVVGMTELNWTAVDDNVYEVANKTADTFQLLGTDSQLFTAYGSGGTATTVRYFHFYFPTEISIDSLLILDHNFNSDSFVQVALEIADNSAFTTNKKQIAAYTVSGTTDNRILITNLNHAAAGNLYDSGGTAQRYSAISRLRLRMLKSGTTVPQFGECLLAYRYQLQRNPDVPWNNKTEMSNVTDFQSNSGIIKRYTFFRGQARRSFGAAISASAEITMIDDWFNAIAEGTRPFVYIETPSSSAQSYLMLLDDPALAFPLVGPTERSLAFDMTEQPPFLSRE